MVGFQLLLVLGNVDFSDLFLTLKAGAKATPPYATLADAKTAGAVTLNYGAFLSTVITFLIVALAVFILVRLVSLLLSLRSGRWAVVGTTV